MQRLLTNALKAQFRLTKPGVGGARAFPNRLQRPASDSLASDSLASDSADRLRTGAVSNSPNDPKELELNGRKKRG